MIDIIAAIKRKNSAIKNKAHARENPIENIILYIVTRTFGILILIFNFKLGNLFLIIYFLIKNSNIVNVTKTMTIKKQIIT